MQWYIALTTQTRAPGTLPSLYALIISLICAFVRDARISMITPSLVPTPFDGKHSGKKGRERYLMMQWNLLLEKYGQVRSLMAVKGQAVCWAVRNCQDESCRHKARLVWVWIHLLRCPICKGWLCVTLHFCNAFLDLDLWWTVSEGCGGTNVCLVSTLYH